ncbi:VOC family protein [Polaribacter ponticola]|uniref:VOC family protein n=1 Tax=Polaribacter ponticola TaxID=2978475 RepID=A0ABT5SB76_9FLAO|nr:VOC family protein [Polaribacter sp. MSW5]MDD7915367.1 VOC family protein [Polaribacter sp. MSW5]
MFSFLFNHIAISVKNVDKSVAFYQEVLGLKEIKNTASNSKTRWLLLAEDKQLHLIPRAEFAIKTNKAVHFALATNNIHAVVKHLNDLQIEYSDWKGTQEKNYIRKDGILQIYFQDPDGYWIEINNDI